MEREPQELFSKVLWTAQEVLEQYKPERKVYPAKAIFEAFNLSKLDFDLCNYRNHIFTVAHSFDKAEELENELSRKLEAIEFFDGDVSSVFSRFGAFRYLDVNCVSVGDYASRNGLEALCFPRTLREEIDPFFKHYHTYKFLERHVDEIGMDKFLSSIPDLEPFIIYAQVNDTFYWDTHDTSHMYEVDPVARELKEIEDEMKLGR
jgi:hypothetical protein